VTQQQQHFTPEQLAKFHNLNSNLAYFSKNNFKCKPKGGKGLVDLEFNFVQRYIDARLNEQKAKFGWVRAIIVKARQQTCSTYIAARYLKDALLIPAIDVYILTHEAEATATLFDKVDVMYKECPAQVKPGLDADNRKTLAFKNNSKYSVGTAGSSNTGRSKTAQRMHASESAHYADEAVPDLDAGVMQIVPDEPDTELIHESTANGMNWFYKFVMDSLAGLTDFIVIFIPWFWTPEYRRKLPEDFKLTEEEVALKKRHPLDDEQIYWRRRKIVAFKGSIKKFKQEYPATLQEAFQSSGDSFYDMERVRASMTSTVIANTGALILGVDSAGNSENSDQTVLALRRGNQLIRLWKYPKMDSLRLAGIVSDLIEKMHIDRVFMDRSYAKDAILLLHERGYYEVEGVMFSEQADEDIYANKRAEMAFRLKDWLQEGDSGDVSLPNDEQMASDIACIPEPTQNSQGRWIFPPKKDIKKIIGRSTDIFDAIILTFARHVRSGDAMRSQIRKTENTRQGSEFKTLVRQRNETSSDSVTVERKPPPFKFKQHYERVGDH
jgi:hypothetical protein